MKTLAIASLNRGKVIELKDLLKSLSIELITQEELGIPEIEETGLTFIENSILKARHVASISGMPTLADDSGLSVDGLHGAPGVFSARYAGPNATNNDRIQKLLAAMKDIPNEKRSARFHCVLVLLLAEKDPAPLICHGKWEGSILHAPQGTQGFGYDPIFYVPTHDCSAAELPIEEKNLISHRGQAVQQLFHALKSHEILCS